MRFGMIVGISGCGKTTVARQHEDDWFILDSDEVRDHLFGDETVQDKNSLVFDYMFRVTQECLSRDCDVLYVATNLSMKRRATLVKQLKHKFPDLTCHCFVINATIEECHERNAQRHRVVPEWVIERQLRSFQFPCESEGWDSIEIVNNSNVSPDTVRANLKKKLEEFGSQDNPHHTLSLMEHTQKVMDNVPWHLNNAAFYHDIGKLFTRTYDENGIAHYYNHQNVGAYLTMNCGASKYTCQLVCAHMDPFNKNFRGDIRYGAPLWSDILILHEADINA